MNFILKVVWSNWKVLSIQNTNDLICVLNGGLYLSSVQPKLMPVYLILVMSSFHLNMVLLYKEKSGILVKGNPRDCYLVLEMGLFKSFVFSCWDHAPIPFKLLFLEEMTHQVSWIKLWRLLDQAFILWAGQQLLNH